MGERLDLDAQLLPPLPSQPLPPPSSQPEQPLQPPHDAQLLLRLRLGLLSFAPQLDERVDKLEHHRFDAGRLGEEDAAQDGRVE